MPFKLSSVLRGHTGDVRDLTVTHDGCIVSCSRDKTAKLWKPNGSFIEAQTFIGHKNFISSVCVIPPNDVFPSGLIVTGGNDNIIQTFKPDSSTPFQQLTGHEDTVCRIVNTFKPNKILSASWDKTVKFWNILEGESRCLLTIKNHEAAVWAVLYLKQDLIVTGSADKTIKIFSLNGSLIKTLTGHEDCVRDLAAITDNEILSCSNDATVRKWSIHTGECLDILYGHPNFIYSICVHGDLIVSGGEDRCLSIWFRGTKEILTLPAQSVWSVAVLPNNDIVTGSSDGVIRIFTIDESRLADQETLLNYTNEVAESTIMSEKHLGGVKVSDLPGLETLEEPGTKEGQTKVVRENEKNMCYSWSQKDKKWNKMGNVMGGSGGTTETSGKVLYEGKEYDYVFNVDIEDGKGPLKLPYNKTEDPWRVAQTFIHKQDLPQQYLEQVAYFIINNSKQSDLPSASTTHEYVDPFTGGNRYVPQGSDVNTNVNSTDPFTGGNRYIPMEISNSERPVNNFFPQTSYIRFDQANIDQILDKLIAFNNDIEDENLRFSEIDLLNVSKLCDLNNANCAPEILEVLKKLLSWPQVYIFPVLDILRLAVRNENVNNMLCSDKYIFGYIKDNLQMDSPVANQMLSLRTLSNILHHNAGEKLVLSHKDFILEVIRNLPYLSNKSLQIASVTLALNMVAAFYKYGNIECQSIMLMNLMNIFPKLTDQESIFRALVALGTILTQSNELSNFIDLSTKQLIGTYTNNGSEKVKLCSEFVKVLIL